MSASKEGMQGVLVYISVCNFLFHKDHLDKDTEKKKEIPLGGQTTMKRTISRITNLTSYMT